jgi:hypothetical protein
MFAHALQRREGIGHHHLHGLLGAAALWLEYKRACQCHKAWKDSSAH